MTRRSIVSFFAVGALVLGALVIAPTAQATPAGSAALEPIPDAGGRSNVLESVSCVSSTFCAAVGEWDYGLSQTLAMMWNGSAWSPVTTPNPSADHYLSSVSCVTTSFCMAVGYFNDGSVDGSLAMTWDGISWTVDNPPSAGAAGDGNYLNSVSCPTATSCTAVGSYWDSSLGREQTLAMNWDSGTWSPQTSPNVGGDWIYLNSVSCPSASHCSAVGSYYDATTTTSRTMATDWTPLLGWTLRSSPNIGGGFNDLTSVSCVDSTFCTAVGRYIDSSVSGANQTLTMKWDGSSWSTVSSPNIGSGNNSLWSVSCSSATLCIAAGEYVLAGYVTLTMEWDGTTWSTVSSPNRGSLSNILNEVSCLPSGTCVAVGNFKEYLSSPLVPFAQTLAMTWNGSAWTTAITPNSGAMNNELVSVSCVSDSFCFAVGTYDNGMGDGTFITKWDGTTWNIVPSPNDPAYSSYLSAVSCVSTTACTAVGYANGPYRETFWMEWDGTSWTIITGSPNIGAYNNELKSVSCVSATLCTAVGSYDNGSEYQSLIVTRDGGTWSTPSSPNVWNELRSVSCVSAVSVSCIAVGYAYNGSVNQTLTLKFDGATWAIVSSPNAGTESDQLSSVSCTSATECTAVGFYSVSSVWKTLVLTWNGVSWATVSSPNIGSDDNGLWRVSCSSSTSCIAVGNYHNAPTYDTLVLAWNGAFWSTITSPNIGTNSNYASGISCVSSTSCTAVGSYSDDGMTYQTLALAIDPPPAFTVPAAPTSLVATVGNTTVSIAFSAGAAGTDPITKYQYTTNDGASWTDVSAGGTSSPITINGLTNYTAYSIKLRAFSTYGGTPSTAVSVETKNAAPTITTAYSARKSGVANRGIYVEVSKLFPSNGTMTNYSVTAYTRGTDTVVSTCTGNAIRPACFLTGLTTGTQYDLRATGTLRLTTAPNRTPAPTTLQSTTTTVRV